jgi:hypothetical protein
MIWRKSMAEQSGKSRKQSGGSRPYQSQLEEFVLYLDENLCNCRPVLDALISNSVRYERHLQHFASGTPDRDWLPFVGQQHWVLLTRDQNIRYQGIEHTLVIRYNIREFVFKAGNLNKEDLATVLMLALPQMKRVCQKYEPPFIATITKLGVVNMRYDKNGPLHGRFAPKQ